MPLARLLLAVFVVVAYVLALASFIAPPPTFLIAATLLGLATMINLGTYFLNLGVFLDVESRATRSTEKAIALTFDDGPHPVHTRRVLDLLDAAGVKATFFVVGQKVDAHPDVVREIAARGHELGLHSYSHDRFLNMRYEPRIVDDLRRTQQAIERAASVTTTLFRPPVGFSSPRTRVAVKALGLRVIGWSARAFDGAGRPSVKQILDRIEPRIEAGAIVLLHDSAERGDLAPTSIEALPELLAVMRLRGFSGVTVSQLLGGQPDASPARDDAAAPSARPV